MAKFKVGDKVNCANYGNGVITKIITSGMPEIPYYVVFESGKELYLGEDRLTLLVTREFIVIHRSGNVMTAEHRVNRDVIKSAKATCAPSDTFDFDTGAKLAFDRLMGREEPKPAPQPARRFKVGDRVITPIGHGEIRRVDDNSEIMPYLIKYDDGYNFWHLSSKAILEPAPAPEPQKYYTGKVFAVKSTESKYPSAHALARNGRLFKIVDGVIIGDLKPYGLNNDKLYASFDEFEQRWFSTEWREVKE